MSDGIWRVEWNLKGTRGPAQCLEFAHESNATNWAEGLLSAGANGIVAKEFIAGRTIYFNAPSPLFPSLNAKAD